MKTSDFLIESFTPGYLDDLGLGYSKLAEINPVLQRVGVPVRRVSTSADGAR